MSLDQILPMLIGIWSKGCATASREFKWTGEAASSGWNEVLDRASKQPGANVRKNRDYSF